MKVSAGLLTTAQERPLEAIDMVNAYSHSTFAAKPSYPAPGNWLHGANRALMRRVQAGQRDINLFAHDFGVCNAYANGLEAASQVRCASHLVLGEQDQMTMPKAAAAIAAALSAKITTLPGGHALMQEAPDGLLRALQLAV